MGEIRDYRKRNPKAQKACYASKKKHVPRIARRRNKITTVPNNLDDETMKFYEDLDVPECDSKNLYWEAFNILDYW